MNDVRVWQVQAPDEGDAGQCRHRFGIAFTRPASFAVERRRGWAEAAGSPPRAAADMWDEERAHDLRMEKARPTSGGATHLAVQGYFAAFRESLSGRPGLARYEIVDARRTLPLPDAQWADWAADGRLLVATTDGRLQVRTVSEQGLTVVFEENIAHLTANPAPPPAEAHRW